MQLLLIHLTAALLLQLQNYHTGQDPKPLDETAKIVAELTAHPGLAADKRQTARELASLLETNSTYECKQFVCRQLALIGAAEQVPALSKMLADEKLSDMARYALGPIRDPSVDKALRAALSKTDGKTQAGIINTIGFRRDTQAVAPLADILDSTDLPLVFRAAAMALAHIGNDAAGAALQHAFALANAGPSGSRQTELADALSVCAEGFLARGKKSRAAEIYRTLLEPKQPERTRAAGLRGLMFADENAADGPLIAALRGNDPRLKQTAVGCIRLRRSQATTDQLIQELELPSYSSADRISILNALADRREPAVAKALTRATHSSDSKLRLAALEDLGKTGGSPQTALLMQAAINGATSEERNAAFDSLRVLRGRGIDALILKNMDQAPAGARAQFIGVLVDRVAVSAVPKLLRLAGDSDLSVAAAAFQALGQLAPPNQLPALARLLARVQSDAVRGAAEDAVVETAGKISAAANQNSKRQAQSIVAVLRQQNDSAVRCSLLRVLGRIGGPEALSALQSAAANGSEAERDAAVRQLSNWQDSSGLEALSNLLQTADNPRHRALALRGYLRLVSAADELSTAQKVERFRRVLAQLRSPDEQKLALAGLAGAPDAAALQLTLPFLDQPAVRAEAAQAALQIADQIYASDRDGVKAAMRQLIERAPDPARRAQAEAILQKIGQLKTYLTEWQVAGPYFERGKNFQALFDIPFPPEKSQTADWRTISAGADAERPWVIDLLKALGGNQRVAYLRTAVYSEKEQPARLELGSDDGVKVWLNGKLVHANNVARPLTPDSDQVNVTLQRGWNRLLVKVTQNNQGWACCARLVQLDGSAIEGMRSAPQPAD